MYSIQGFQTTDTSRGCDAERTADTLKDAKRQARYMRSEDYRVASEAYARLSVVQIFKDSELILEL